MGDLIINRFGPEDISGGDTLFQVVELGKTFELTVSAYHTAGYTWHLTCLPGGIALIDIEDIGPENSEAVGASGQTKYTFRAMKIVEDKKPLRLELRRVFEAPDTDLAMFLEKVIQVVRP